MTRRRLRPRAPDPSGGERCRSRSAWSWPAPLGRRACRPAARPREHDDGDGRRRRGAAGRPGRRRGPGKSWWTCLVARRHRHRVGLWELRPELTAVPYLDDSSIHEQMVRFASARLSAGHSPLTSWFPYLGLGSPQFLHYQSLPSMISGVFGTVFDPNTVFRWSMYLLLALWPLVDLLVGAAVRARSLDGRRGRGRVALARLVGRHRLRGHGLHLARLRRLDAAVGVVDAAPGVGLQLPRHRRAALDPPIRAAGRLLHHGDGRPSTSRRATSRSWRWSCGRSSCRPTCGVGSDGRCWSAASALLASAWVIVPVLAQSHWAARNQVLEGTGLENGYGARHFLWLLITGRVFDSLHWFPIITIFVGVGLSCACGGGERSSSAVRCWSSSWSPS